MRRLRGRARLTAFNVAATAVALGLVALVAEGWVRNRSEFRHNEVKYYLHPRAGRLYVPGSAVRWTNMLDFWTVSRANRWGFLDRPPPPFLGKNERRGPSCRVAVVGDSFVAAREVAVSDKLHVRFEEMARSRLPTLRVSASAYGHPFTGQINQLGFYDEFVSRTSPDIVVLVFVHNDFQENFFSRPRPLWVTATRGDDGTLELRPPTWEAGLDALAAQSQASISGSYAFAMLESKADALWRRPTVTRMISRFRRLTYRSPPATLVDLPAPGLERRLEYTGFALDQWKLRAQRDNFVLLALASHSIADWLFEQLRTLASARDIPVVYQRSYVRRRNAQWRDGHFAHDSHWNATGHQWAAEALLEWLEQNQAACPSVAGGPLELE